MIITEGVSIEDGSDIVESETAINEKEEAEEGGKKEVKPLDDDLIIDDEKKGNNDNGKEKDENSNEIESRKRSGNEVENPRKKKKKKNKKNNKKKEKPKSLFEVELEKKGFLLIFRTFEKLVTNLEAENILEQKTEAYISKFSRVLESCQQLCDEYRKLCLEVDEKKNSNAKSDILTTGSNNGYGWNVKRFDKLWQDCGAICMTYLYNNFHILAETLVYEETKEMVFPWDLLFTTYLTCIYNSHRGSPLRYDKYSEIKPRDITYVRKHKLVRSENKISSMRLNELLDSILEINARCLEIPYHVELVQYVELLEARLFEFYIQPQSSVVLNVEVMRLDYRKAMGSTNSNSIPLYNGYVIEGDATQKNKKEASKEENYILTEAAMRQASMPLVMMHKMFCTYQSIDEANERDWEEFWSKYDEQRLKAIATKLDQYVVELANLFNRETVNTLYHETFLALSVRPLEMFTYVQGSKSHQRKREGTTNRFDPDTIMGKVRDRSVYNRLLEASKRQLCEILKEKKTKLPFERPLAIMCLINSVFTSKCAIEVLGEHFVYRLYLNNAMTPENNDIERIITRKTPSLLQTFNYFALCYKKKQYRFQEFTHALAAWLMILMHENHGELGGKTMLPFVKDAFGIATWSSLFGINYQPTEDDHLRESRNFSKKLFGGNTGLEKEIVYL